MSHACHEAGKWFEESNPKMELDEPAYMCLFEVKDEMELYEASKYLDKHDIDYHMFNEPDFGDQYTAICTITIEEPEKRALFENFRLYR